MLLVIEDYKMTTRKVTMKCTHAKGDCFKRGWYDTAEIGVNGDEMVKSSGGYSYSLSPKTQKHISAHGEYWFIVA